MKYGILNVTLLIRVYESVLLFLIGQNVKYHMTSNGVSNNILCSVQNANIVQNHYLIKTVFTGCVYTMGNKS